MKIFIAYNTNSVVNKVKSSKWFKKVESANINTEEQEKKPCCLTISPQEEQLRLHTFKAINDIYKRKGQHELFFDILNENYSKPGLHYHIDINKNIIEGCDLLFFIISEEEISFWQLQEAFFASYFNKPIMFIDTEKFVKLIIKQKFDRYLLRKKKLLNKYNHSNSK